MQKAKDGQWYKCLCCFFASKKPTEELTTPTKTLRRSRGSSKLSPEGGSNLSEHSSETRGNAQEARKLEY